MCLFAAKLVIQWSKSSNLSMQNQNINLDHISLKLGLTKNELRKRIANGLDLEVTSKQLSEYSQELKLSAQCEAFFQNNKAEIVEIDQVQFSK